MTAALLVGALVGFLGGFLAALRWVDYFTLLEDKRRLDWLQEEQDRFDAVAILMFRPYYRRDRSTWAMVAGSIRERIDRGRKTP